MQARLPTTLLTANLRGGHIQLRFRLNRVLVPPGIIAAKQCAGIEAFVPKLTRHTGASCLVASGAVGDKRTLLDRGIHVFFRPLADLVWQHANTAGDLPIPLGIMCSRANVENDRWR
jgi:hypothetical protein